jgi:transposase
VASQRWSQIFARIGQPALERFFTARIKRASGSYWFMNTTSILSYLQLLERVRWGKSKDGVLLPQINLAVVKDAGTGAPLAFKDLPGNIPDVTQVKALLTGFARYGAGRMKLCMDRGFYSKANIDALMGAHEKFLIGVSTSISYVATAFRDHTEQVRDWRHHDTSRRLYGMCIDHPWKFEQTHPYADDEHAVKRSYLHIFFDPTRAISQLEDFDKLLQILDTELATSQLNPAHETFYRRWCRQTGSRWEGDEQAIQAERDRHGWFTLLSNDATLTCWEALDVYRSQDQIEKAFNDVKDRLDIRTSGVHNQETVTGKLFTMFVALILTTELRRRMHTAVLDKDYTLTELLDELETIEQYVQPGKLPRTMHVTTKQASLYTRLQVTPPTTS